METKKNHPSLSVEHLIDIGDACYCLGDYYRALESYFPALKTLITTFGSKHLDIARVYYDIGMTYSKLGRSNEALFYLFKVCEIREEVLGSNHSDIAATYKSIAKVYSHCGYGYWLWNCDDDEVYLLSEIRFCFNFHDICVDSYKTAMEYYRRALDCYKSITSACDSTKHEIETAIETMKTDKEKKDREALACYLKVLEIRWRLYGADSIPYAQILYCIGLVYSNMNELPNAMEYYQRSLAIYKNEYGTEHYCSRYIRNQFSIVTLRAMS